MNTEDKTFYWGASTSAHQVDGNAHNNWSQWEKANAQRLATDALGKWEPWQQEKFPEMFLPENYISAVAADHYNRYEEDFDLIRDGGHSAHRFSIDWARIEPHEGDFNLLAIAHYVDVVKALRARNLEPFVTLWHWTHPIWLEERGGVLATDFSEKFAAYAQIMIDAFARDGVSVRFVMTLNEPMSVISSQYVTGAWPHAKKGIFAALTAYKNLSRAHVMAYKGIKQKHPDTEVGFTEIFTSYEPRHADSLLDRFVVHVADYWSNKRFIKMCAGAFDFIGVQYYFHHRIGVSGVEKKVDAARSDLGWELHAEGLGRVIDGASRYGVPLYVTEDGLADRSDEARVQFLDEHVGQVMHMREKGVDVRGYFHWSLLDNFEWDKGYWPRFGLVAVDFDTHKRTPRPSYFHYKELIEQYSGGGTEQDNQ